jgi:hypothetical protein
VNVEAALHPERESEIRVSEVIRDPRTGTITSLKINKIVTVEASPKKSALLKE